MGWAQPCHVPPSLPWLPAPGTTWLFILLSISVLPITISHHLLFQVINFSFPVSEGLTPTHLGHLTSSLHTPPHGTPASQLVWVALGAGGGGGLGWPQGRGMARQKEWANGAHSLNRFNFCRGGCGVRSHQLDSGDGESDLERPRHQLAVIDGIAHWKSMGFEAGGSSRIPNNTGSRTGPCCAQT